MNDAELKRYKELTVIDKSCPVCGQIHFVDDVATTRKASTFYFLCPCCVSSWSVTITDKSVSGVGRRAHL